MRVCGDSVDKDGGAVLFSGALAIFFVEPFAFVSPNCEDFKETVWPMIGLERRERSAKVCNAYVSGWFVHVLAASDLNMYFESSPFGEQGNSIAKPNSWTGGGAVVDSIVG